MMVQVVHQKCRTIQLKSKCRQGWNGALEFVNINKYTYNLVEQAVKKNEKEKTNKPTATNQHSKVICFYSFIPR